MFNDAITKAAIDIYNDEIEIPHLINRSATRKFLLEEFSHVGTGTIDFIEVVLFVFLRYVSVKTKAKEKNRVSPKDVRDVLVEASNVNMSFGSIRVISENPDVSEERIATRVIERLSLRSIVAEKEKENRTKKKIPKNDDDVSKYDNVFDDEFEIKRDTGGEKE
jgi:hypothetical protein